MNVTLSSSKMNLISIFGVFILLFCNECASTKTVIFIYDKADTTAYDIDHLSGNIRDISTQLFNDGLDFHFKIIFPYKSRMMEITNSKASYTRMNNVNRIKGQSTLKNLQTQLCESPKNSVICVITNITTPAVDDTLIRDVLKQIQIKRTEVNFLLETDHFLQSDALRGYTLITSISNGLILTSNSFAPDQFPDSMYSWIKSFTQKVNLLAVQHTDNGKYCFSNDALLKNKKTDLHMVFRSCHSNEFQVRRRTHWQTMSEGVIKEKDNELQFHITHSLNVVEVCVSIWNINQNSEHPPFFNIKVFGKSDFDIDYGFSIDPVRSLNETCKRPINNRFNRIYITSSETAFQAKFLYFNVLFLNGTSYMKKTPLYEEPDTGLFSALFEPPNAEYFYIEVTAEIEGETVTRMSSTAMNAVEGNCEDENNPACSEFNDNDLRYINLKLILLLIAFSGLAVVLLCQFFRYIECFTKVPELLEIEKPHRKVVPNFYQPTAAGYKAQEKKVLLN